MISGLPERLKNLRKIKNLSRKQVAERIGVSEALIGFYESGARQPSLYALIKLSSLYNVSTDYLLGCKPPESPSVSLNGLSEEQLRALEMTINCFRNL